jgi:asparagine synthase (glutamine-hydrolysing)
MSSPAVGKAGAFREVFEASLSDIADRTGGLRTAPDESVRRRCVILSGGVDTCAIMSAARILGIRFGGAITVALTSPDGEEPPDLAFSAACAAEHRLSHHVVRLTASDLVDVFLPAVVGKLRIYDGMVVRNSLVIAAAFAKAAELGFMHAVVGDGADELFGGYSFTWGHADDRVAWREKRDSMCARWTFSTDDLGEMYGIEAHSPYTAERTRAWAIENTERNDCIGVRPIRLLFGGKYEDHVTGKLILREAYDTVSSWRRKDPIEVGSGATVIGHDAFWRDRVSDEEFRAESDALALRGYAIHSKEYLVNFRVWEGTFGPDGLRLTDMSRLPIGEGCVGCCFDIGTERMFCNLCGAYPAQRQTCGSQS